MYGRRIDPLLRPDAGDIPYRTWETYDPRVEDFFCERNRYLTGPGAYLPPEHQPYRAYNLRGHNMPVRLCIRGIHPHTTQEGIGHMLSQYANPILIDRKRNRNNEVIAFVEFATQREADNVIIALDGKPPLNWRVTYAFNRCEDSFANNFSDLSLASEIESQQPLFSGSVIQARALPPASAQTGASLALPPSSQATKYPPCVVCGNDAGTVCVICKTRYCSARCQRVDWPAHQNVCIPPPPLAPAGPVESTSAPKPASNVAQSNASVPFVHKPAALPAPPAPSSAQPARTSGEAHAFVIKGITPLDQAQPKQPEPPVAAPKANSPKIGTYSLNLSQSQDTNSAIPSPVYQKPPQQPRVSILAAQTSPLQSTASSVNPSPLPDIRYAKTYEKNQNASPFDNAQARQRAFVCFAKSPEQFFVQHAQNRDALPKLNTELQESVGNCDPVVDPVLGAPCAALFKGDNVWYRAQIMRIFPNNEIGVRFVDYGNIAKMPNKPDNFRMLELKFAKHPGFAVTVKLADILPPNGTTWDSYVKDAFKQIVENKEFFVEVVRNEVDHMIVRLKNENGEDLGDELVKRGLAKAIVRETIGNELDPKSTPPRVLAFPPPQVAQRPVQKAASPRSVLAPPPPQVAQRPFPRTASPMNRHPMPNRSTPPAQTKPTPQPSPKPSMMQQANALPPRAGPPPAQTPRMPNVKPQLKSSPAHQVVKKPSVSILSKLIKGVETKFAVTELSGNEVAGTIVLDDHTQALEFHSVAETTPMDPTFIPLLKTIVSAFSEQFQNWFRGYVLAKKGTTYDVLYVDYGNVEKGIQKVKPLPPKYNHPELAVNIVFDGDVSESFLEALRPETAHRVLVSSVGDEECACVFDEEENVKARMVSWMHLVPRDIPVPKLEIGQSADVLVLLAEDVDKIFVLPTTDESIENTTAVQQKMAKILDGFDSIPKLKSPPKVGSYVAAVFPDDGNLYRARVVSIEGDAITVDYIDYGNAGSVTLDLVRPLPDELFDHPIGGRCVSLSQIERPDGPLPEQVKAVLSGIVDQICTMTVTAINGSVEVVLSKDGCVINEKISDALQAAVAAMPALAPAPAPEEKPIDYTLGEFKYDDGPFAEIVVGSTMTALVLDSGDPRILMFCPGDEEKLAKLNDLQEEIQPYADSTIRTYSPQLGEVCLGRTPDGLWYRVACLEVEGEGDSARHSCVQVDYGKSGSYGVADLRRIPQRFVHALPYLAFQGILAEVKDLGEPSDALRKRLLELLPERSVTQLTVVSLDEVIYVVSIPGVGDQLVKEGLL